MSENDLSRKIRDLRSQHGLTLEQVAQQVGVGKSTVRKWETGFIENMRRDKIAKLASALHTSPAYLMGWEDNPQPVHTAAPASTLSATDQDLTAAEQILIKDFRTLNAEGQQKLLEYASDLRASGRYIKTTSGNSIPKQA